MFLLIFHPAPKLKKKKNYSMNQNNNTHMYSMTHSITLFH